MALLYAQVDNNWASTLHGYFETIFFALCLCVLQFQSFMLQFHLSMHKTDSPVCCAELGMCAALALSLSLRT